MYMLVGWADFSFIKIQDTGSVGYLSILVDGLSLKKTAGMNTEQAFQIFKTEIT